MEEGTYCKQKEKKREIKSSLKKQRKINNCFSLVFFFFSNSSGGFCYFCLVFMEEQGSFSSLS
jgi:hypothetical protein